jgi:hypothetical protein
LVDFYSFILEEKDGTLRYFFNTVNELRYFVWCVPSDELEYGNSPNLKEKGYFIGFDCTGIPSTKDPLVGKTICRILLQLFTDLGNDCMLVFNADDSDEKHVLRHRLFRIWHNEFGIDNSILESLIIEQGDKTHYLGCIINKSNSKLEESVEEFRNLKFELIKPIL